MVGCPDLFEAGPRTGCRIRGRSHRGNYCPVTRQIEPHREPRRVFPRLFCVRRAVTRGVRCHRQAADRGRAARRRPRRLHARCIRRRHRGRGARRRRGTRGVRFERPAPVARGRREAPLLGTRREPRGSHRSGGAGSVSHRPLLAHHHRREVLRAAGLLGARPRDSAGLHRGDRGVLIALSGHCPVPLARPLDVRCACRWGRNRWTSGCGRAVMEKGETEAAEAAPSG